MRRIAIPAAAALAARDAQAEFESCRQRATRGLGATFFISSALNCLLVTPALTGPAATAAFNEASGS